MNQHSNVLFTPSIFEDNGKILQPLLIYPTHRFLVVLWSTGRRTRRPVPKRCVQSRLKSSIPSRSRKVTTSPFAPASAFQGHSDSGAGSGSVSRWKFPPANAPTYADKHRTTSKRCAKMLTSWVGQVCSVKFNCVPQETRMGSFLNKLGTLELRANFTLHANSELAWPRV